MPRMKQALKEKYDWAEAPWNCKIWILNLHKNDLFNPKLLSPEILKDVLTKQFYVQNFVQNFA